MKSYDSVNPDSNGTLYILRDIEGYGNYSPVCVSLDDAERLMKEWYGNDDDAFEFNDIWREADKEDIAMYGVDEG